MPKPNYLMENNGSNIKNKKEMRRIIWKNE
jgi:hypothetical protein